MLVDTGVDPDELAGEALAAVSSVARTAAAARVGAPAEWIIVGAAGTLVVRRLAELDLHLVLRVKPDAWLGRARFAARVAAGRIAQALAPKP
jgi:predicted regulator of Ras-like GTPase activity (Roadblock/LC7/MglB family)